MYMYTVKELLCTDINWEYAHVKKDVWKINIAPALNCAAAGKMRKIPFFRESRIIIPGSQPGIMSTLVTSTDHVNIVSPSLRIYLLPGYCFYTSGIYFPLTPVIIFPTI